MHWLNSPVVLKIVRELTGGSASPHLNVRDIRALNVPVPPMPEQQEIVRRMSRLFSMADNVEERFAKAYASVNDIRQSLLRKAFRGDLVRTEAELAQIEGRDFESAEHLLDRVSEELAAESP